MLTDAFVTCCREAAEDYSSKENHCGGQLYKVW